MAQSFPNSLKNRNLQIQDTLLTPIRTDKKTTNTEIPGS